MIVFFFVSGTAYEKYLTDDMYPDEPPIEDSPTDISRDDELDDGSTYIDDGKFQNLGITFFKILLSSFILNIVLCLFELLGIYQLFIYILC